MEASQTETEKESNHTAQRVSQAEQDKLLSLVSNVQRGRMEEQRCTLNPSRKTLLSPQKNVSSSPSGSDNEQLFELLVNSQRGRLDDQRMAIGSPPGTQASADRDQKADHGSTHEQALKQGSPGHRPLSPKIDGLKGSPQKLLLTPDSPGILMGPGFRPASPTPSSPRSACPTGTAPLAASSSAVSDKEKKKPDAITPTQGGEPANPDQLISLVSHMQHGRMEDQRCSLQPVKKVLASPKDTNTSSKAQDADDLFDLLANTRSHRLDDQRVTLNSRPGTQAESNAKVTSATGEDSEKLCNILSRVQGSRMDEQRCLVPSVLLGSRGTPKKTPARLAEPLSKPPHRSSSFTPASETQRARTTTNHSAQAQGSADEDSLFSLVHHLQREQMDDQRCSFEQMKRSSSTPDNNMKPAEPDADQFFRLISNSQSSRLDDQRVSLNLGGARTDERKMLPTQKSNQHCNAESRAGMLIPPTSSKMDEPKDSHPKITLTPGSPSPSMRSCSRPVSPTEFLTDSASTKSIPSKSASFGSVSDRERRQYDAITPSQLTFQVTMCFTPHQGCRVDCQHVSYPEVLLTLGPPGKGIVVPLSPVAVNPASVNMTPSQGRHSRSSSPGRISPRDGRSRSPSPSPPPPMNSPINPEEDYMSLIHRIHATHLQSLGGKGMGKAVVKKEKGKGEGKKDKRNGRKRS